MYDLEILIDCFKNKNEERIKQIKRAYQPTKTEFSTSETLVGVKETPESYQTPENTVNSDK